MCASNVQNMCSAGKMCNCVSSASRCAAQQVCSADARHTTDRAGKGGRQQKIAGNKRRQATEQGKWPNGHDAEAEDGEVQHIPRQAAHEGQQVADLLKHHHPQVANAELWRTPRSRADQ